MLSKDRKISQAISIISLYKQLSFPVSHRDRSWHWIFHKGTVALKFIAATLITEEDIQLGIIMKEIENKPATVVIPLYKSILGLHLEYCSVYLILKKYTVELKKVQKGGINMIGTCATFPIWGGCQVWSNLNVPFRLKISNGEPWFRILKLYML